MDGIVGVMRRSRVIKALSVLSRPRLVAMLWGHGRLRGSALAKEAEVGPTPVGVHRQPHPDAS